MSEFSSWRAFTSFEKEVQRNRRYIRTTEAEQFLQTVRNTVHSRKSNISKGRGFWRAQVGHDWRFLEEIGGEIPSAFPPERMKPLADRALEGRANSKGIPMLYLCTSKDAAMSEVRPWVGTMISLGHFITKKNLSLVDCSRNSNEKPKIYLSSPSIDQWTDIVWADIDRAFTKPVTRTDDVGEYVATQILVELFRDIGFDGIAYGSAFDEKATNIALFDLNCAELVGCQLHEATSVRMNFRERDNPYWVRRSKKGTENRRTKK